jgi:hypothetical protein
VCKEIAKIAGTAKKSKLKQSDQKNSHWPLALGFAF